MLPFDDVVMFQHALCWQVINSKLSIYIQLVTQHIEYGCHHNWVITTKSKLTSWPKIHPSQFGRQVPICRFLDKGSFFVKILISELWRFLCTFWYIFLSFLGVCLHVLKYQFEKKLHAFGRWYDTSSLRFSPKKSLYFTIKSRWNSCLWINGLINEGESFTFSTYMVRTFI